ncbi:MAG TPA: methyltransferase domain-containing protein [Myxococcota bacterium]|nr:methyltransferase domain-containing protein [Myxococcota bacterium]
MRVVDLDRDMRDVIPTSTSPDSDYLFEQMTRRTLDRARGRRVLDVASGFGQDARALAQGGAIAVAAEPSARMSALARLQDESGATAPIHHVRSWADALPFASGSFDAVYCKGALDHFDTPCEAISEMARVTRDDGRVVLAIANFDSLSCRVARAVETRGARWLGRDLARGRRHYDVPHDHFTRYDLPLMCEQAGESLTLDLVEGVSLGWGLTRWSRLARRLPPGLTQWLLRALDAIARGWPEGADVVVLAGRPRRSSAESSA